MTLRTRRRKTTRSPLCELLEGRIVLSTIIGTGPAAGAVLAHTPAAFSVTFDSPVDPFSLNPGDIVIDRVAPDGSLTPAYDASNVPSESLDDSGTVLTLDAPSPLTPGRYRLVLSGSSSLAGLDGSAVANADGSDQPLGDFTIDRPGVGLSDAIDLGAIGARTVAVAGNLDFAANPSAVDLYKFTLPAGHNYRLGAAVTVAGDGSPLESGLALFDSQGRAISTDSQGLPSSPNDPYLFSGLHAGTYYLGVSGASDLPGRPGGYDLATRTSGVQQEGPGGAFTLDLVADDADLPGALIGFSVQHADPLDPTPSGFTLQFSSPLDLGRSGSSVYDRSTSGVDLVDQDGRTWPVDAVSYDGQHAAISYLFSDHLPKGRYTLKMDAQHPLVDLSGLAPISPTLPAGVLATFAVGPDLRDRSADGTLAIPAAILAATARPAPASSEDLGALVPDAALKGVTRTFTVQPGQTAAFRLVSLYKDYYKIGINHSGGPVQVILNGAGGQVGIDPGPDGQDNTTLQELATGPYILEFTATGDAPVTITARVGIGAFSWDSLLANGLGQGPALNLRLVSDASPLTSGTGAATVASSHADAPSPSGPAEGPKAEAAAISAATETAPQTPSARAASPGSLATHASAGLAADVGGTLVGRPSLDAEHVAAVGPGATSDAIAMASTATGPGQALAAMGPLMGPFRPSDPIRPDPQAEPAEPEAITDGSMTPAARRGSEVPNPAGPVAEAASPSPSPSPRLAAGADRPATIDGVVSLAPSGLRPEPEEAEAPAGIAAWVAGLAGISAIGARWYLKRKRNAARHTVARRVIPAPHVARARVKV